MRVNLPKSTLVILLPCYQTDIKGTNYTKTNMERLQKPQFSAVQHAFAVKCFLETRSGKRTRTLKKFCDKRHVNRQSAATVPSINSIKNWVRAFESRDSDKEKLLFPKSLKFKQQTDENLERVEESVIISPKSSIRRWSSQLVILRESLRRILKLDLKLKPYVVQLHQRLTPCMCSKELKCAIGFCKKLSRMATS